MAVTERKAAAKRKREEPPDPFAAQQELTPVAQATAQAGDDARRAIATISAQLTEFDKVEAGIAELERKYKGVVYAVGTPAGLKDAIAARLEIRKPRFALEDARKAAKAPVLDLGRDIDARAAKIKPRLMALETPIDDQIKAQEAKEEARKQRHEDNIAEIAGTPAKCIGKTSAQLQEVLDALESVPLADYEEYRERAAQAQFAAAGSVRQLLAQAKDAEDAERLRRERQEADERRATLQARVDAIGDVLQFPYRTSQRVQQAVDRLNAFEIGEDFAEFGPAAREKKAEVLVLLAEKFNQLATVENDAEKRKHEEGLRAAVAGADQRRAQANAGGYTRLGAESSPSPVAAPAGSGQRYIMGGMPDRDYHEGLERRAESALVENKTAGEPADYAGQQQLREFIAGPVEDDSQSAGWGHPTQRDYERFGETFPPRDTQERPAESGELSMRVQRPSDAEILGVVASHYDVTWTVAASWLRAMDFHTALAQMPLEG